MKLEDVLLRDTRANQPAANTVPEGTLYYVTDEAVTEQSRSAAWVDYSDAGSNAGIDQLTGDVTAGPGSGSQAATIANNAVTTAKINNLAVTTGKLDNLAVTTGKITDDNVTYAKIQNVSATDRLLGRDTAGAGDIEEIPVSSGLEFSGGPGLRTTTAARTRQIGITVDGGGSLLTTGAKGFKSFPVAGTITGWRLIADAAGDIEFDVLKSTYAAFPTQASIVASAPPELSGVQKNEDTTLTGWTTSVAAGDVFGFSIGGTPATITRVTLELTIVVS
jgi:uncharacterized protein DUF5907